MKPQYVLIFFLFICFSGFSQVKTGKTGAWYMYFYDHQFKDSQFGIQGDLQYRNWNFIGDLEQLLLRSGLTYRPKNANLKFTLGYGHITSGEFGDGNSTSTENRIYQEASIPQSFGKRWNFNHRFRYEQRFVENQDFRTRYRYALFLNYPLNKTSIETNAIYVALYNELFINGQKEVGDNRSVELFDRNRTYIGLGYQISASLSARLGWMNQKVDAYGKGQFQVSLHHKI